MNTLFTAILLGPPGSGKSTQADFLVREMEAVHVDIGLALRKTAEMNTPLGARVADIMNRRKELVPDDIVEEVLSGALASVPPNRLVIVDGAPRCETQIEIIDAILKTFERRVNLAVYVALSEEESVRRISRRWMCSQCNQSFVSGVDFSEGNALCPSCALPLSRRKDDTEEGVRKRFQVFSSNTLPVVDHYRKEGTLLEVDGTQDPITIFGDIRKRIMSNF
ncbi:MAG: nucleoside monophosphate kinase [Candidatus Moraniibacteriota bacterium]